MRTLTRRECLLTLGAAAVVARQPRVLATGTSAKQMRGAFMILHTPFTTAGEVDWDDLAREAAFVDRSGCQGIVWPQGSSGVMTLTQAERVQGMDVLGRAVAGKRVALVLGVQGRDIPEMLDFATRAEAIGPDAMIAMPPTSGTSMDDYRAYFRALAGVTRRPIIVQTSGGAPKLPPTTDLLIDLAREFPHLAYVKEESDPLLPRMQAEIRARPLMKGIFGASLGTGWLYEMRLGLDGIITGMGMYADVMARIWDLHERGRHEDVRDAYGKFLLMRNLNEAIPGTDLYMMKKRGVFKTTVRRTSAPTASAPAKLTEFTPSPIEIEEIEFRFAGLKTLLTQ